MQVRVARKVEETPEICSFELVRADGGVLPPFSAGSHIDVETPGGLTRQYSLWNLPGDSGQYHIAVLKEPTGRGGSRSMHEQVREGDLLTISAPKNHFSLVAEATHSLLIAGGIGITPILCMAERLSHIGAPFKMHYCTRNASRTAFTGHIAAADYASAVQFHFSEAGRVDLRGLLSCPAPGAHVYVCGPKGFMDAVLSAARAAAWPESQLHYEFFAGNAVAGEGDAAFEVKLASSGRVIPVAADRTVVEALRDHGIEVPTSCEQGVCGTCLTRVLEGIPDHRDMYFTEAERAANDQFLPCCSRARSPRLVLDL